MGDLIAHNCLEENEYQYGAQIKEKAVFFLMMALESKMKHSRLGSPTEILIFLRYPLDILSKTVKDQRFYFLASQ